jgi:hypothetical protein
LTIDNELFTVKYGGVSLSVSGSKGDWTTAKSVTFTADRCNPKQLEIHGTNFEGVSNACQTGGLLMTCKSASGSPWNGYIS